MRGDRRRAPLPLGRFGGWLCSLLGLAPAAAQSPDLEHRPELGQRTARLFDFEEAQTNPLPLPRHWSRLADDPAAPSGKHPPFNRVELDYTTAYRGEGSVRLRARAGGVVLRLDPGVIPIFPGGDYRVTARVRTLGAVHNRAFLTVRFLDGRAAPIAASQQVSEPVASESEWREVTLRLRGNWEGAAFLQLDLSLLPPRQFDPAAAAGDPHRVWLQDADARAWFDDVTVAQLPRLELSTESPANIVVSPDRPRVTLSLRDLAGESMHARFTLHDGAGMLVDEAEMPVPGGSARLTWEPARTRLGWYRATAHVRSGDRPMGETQVDFACVLSAGGRAASRSPDERLTVAAAAVPAGQWADLPALIDGAGMESISLPLWSDELTAQGVGPLVKAVETALLRLRAEGREVSFSLPRTPRLLAEQTRLSPENPGGAIAAAGDHWKPLLLPFLDEFGQAVQRWELGVAAGPPGATPTRGDVSLVRGIISSLSPGPHITLGWHSGASPDPSLWSGGADGFRVFVPRGAPVSETVRQFVDAAKGYGAEGSLGFALEPSDPSVAPRDAADETFRRAVEALGAGAVEVSIGAPWVWAEQPVAQSMPRPELAAMRTLGLSMRGRRIAAPLDLGNGIVCHVLDAEPGHARSSAIVVWHTSERTGAAATLEMPLAIGPVTVLDRWGNATMLAPEPSRAGKVAPHRLFVTRSPLIVEGVDPGLLRLLSSLHLEPAFLSTDEPEHHVSLTIANPWGSEITGQVLIREPGAPQDTAAEGDAPGAERARRDWTITPRTQRIDISAGRTAALPLTLSFLPSQEAGPHELTVEMDVAGPQTYSGLSARVPFVIGMRGVTLEVACRTEPGGAGYDTVVEAYATNETGRDVALEVIAFAPGRARTAAPTANLGPGEQTSRQFVFSSAGAALRGKRIYVSIRDAETGARLTRSVLVE